MSASGNNAAANGWADRLSLRLLAPDDEGLYCELHTDAATMRFIGPPLSQERAQRSFRKALQLTHRHPAGQRFLAVVDKSTRQTIGICSIQQFDEDRRRAEGGIILKPEARAQGAGKEAFAALVTQGFAMFPIDEIRAHIATDHAAAEGVLVSIGFLRCGDISPTQGHQGKSIWSASRESWCRW